MWRKDWKSNDVIIENFNGLILLKVPPRTENFELNYSPNIIINSQIVTLVFGVILFITLIILKYFLLRKRIN